MAGTKAPLFGLDASGTIAGSLVFSKWRGRTYVRRHAVPANPKSGLQVGVRSTMKFLTQGFKDLSAADKSAWDALAATDNITQLNAQVRDGISRARRNLGIRKRPDATAGVTPDAPTIDSVTAQPKTLVLAWTAGINSPEYAWIIYRSTTSGFNPDISNQIAVVKAGDSSYTDGGLKTGTTYYYKIRGVNDNGELGALSLEGSGTPT